MKAHSLFSVNVSSVQTVMSASKPFRLGCPYYVFCLFAYLLLIRFFAVNRKKLTNRKTDGLKFKLIQIMKSIFKKNSHNFTPIKHNRVAVGLALLRTQRLSPRRILRGWERNERWQSLNALVSGLRLQANRNSVNRLKVVTASLFSKQRYQAEEGSSLDFLRRKTSHLFFDFFDKTTPR